MHTHESDLGWIRGEPDHKIWRVGQEFWTVQSSDMQNAKFCSCMDINSEQRITTEKNVPAPSNYIQIIITEFSLDIIQKKWSIFSIS